MIELVRKEPKKNWKIQNVDLLCIISCQDMVIITYAFGILYG